MNFKKNNMKYNRECVFYKNLNATISAKNASNYLNVNK